MRAYLQTLGVTGVNVDEAWVALSSREAAFLALLCDLHGGRATRVQLTDLLWPASHRRRARHSLSQLIYGLRTRICDDLVSCDKEQIWTDLLQADFIEVVQCARTQDTSKVLTLYAGRFLGHDGSFSAPLREWRDKIEEDVATAVADALQEQSYAVDVSELPTIISVGERLLSIHPHLVAAQIATIEAWVRIGDRRQAQCLYNHYAEQRGDGTDFPLFESFEQGRYAPIRSGHTRLIGRDDEVALLEDCWEDVKSGVGAFAVISGEPGIGKTRLAEHFVRHVALRGGATWAVRCCAATQRLPYSAVGELVRDNTDATAAANYPPALQYLHSPHFSQAPKTDEYRHTLTECLTTLVIDRSRDQPLVILVDDAQWADDYTALLLAYWSYRLASHKVFLILTVRTEDAETPPDWIDSDLGKVTRIPLGRISIEAASRIVDAFESSAGASLTGDLRNAVMWQSAGRPFLLLEALKLAVSNDGTTPPSAHAILSATAESVLSRRFRSLSANAAAALGTLAVWGHELRAEPLGRISGLTAEGLAAALDALHARGIAQWESGQVSFSHDLMREAAYRSLLPPTRALYHSRAAAELLRAEGPDGLIAHHYACAGDTSAATHYASKAASEALAAHLYADYEFYLRMCIEHGTVGDQRLAAENLGRYLVQVGRSNELDSIRHLLNNGADESLLHEICVFERQLAAGKVQASELLERSRDIVAMASEYDEISAVPIIATLLDVALDAGSPTFGEQVAQTLLDRAEERHSEDAAMIIRSVMAVWHGMTSGTSEALRQAELALAGVNSSTSLPVQALCTASYGTLLLLAGKVLLAREYFRSALAAAATAGDHRREWAILNNDGVASLEVGDYTAARKSWARVVTAPNVHCRIRGYGNLAISHYEEGDMVNAKSAAEAVISMNEVYKSPTMGGLAHGILGLVALRQNNERVAARHDGFADVLVPESLRKQAETGYSCSLRARLLMRTGQVDQALQILDQAIAAIQPRDYLAGLRLICEKAELFSTLDSDASYAIAKEVVSQSESLGATLIQNRANKILQTLIHV